MLLKKKTNSNVAKDVLQCIADQNLNQKNHYENQFGGCSKCKRTTIDHPAILYYSGEQDNSKGSKVAHYRDTCLPMLHSTVNAGPVSEPACVHQQKNGPKKIQSKQWSSFYHYYSLKKNKIMPFVRKRMELEIIILEEMNQNQKIKYHMFFFSCHCSFYLSFEAFNLFLVFPQQVFLPTRLS